MVTLKEEPRILCPPGALRIKVGPVATLKEGPRILRPRGTIIENLLKKTLKKK